MFVVDLIYTADLSMVEKHTEAHRKWLDEQCSVGNFIFSGPKNPRSGGIIIAKMDNKSDLEAVLKHDPFAQNKVATYTITEFQARKGHAKLQEFVEK